MPKLDDVKIVIDNLHKKIPTIIGSGVIRMNGLVIESNFSRDINERMVGAMSAALLGTSKRTAESLFKGNFVSLVLALDKGNMFLMSCGKVILVVITEPNPNMGLITLEMEDVGVRLQNLFQVS